MGIAAAAASEIDRLVISLNRAVAPKHGERLQDLARRHGLDTLDLLPPLGDFMLAGALTRELALLRGRYWRAERVQGRLDDLVASGHLAETASGLVATDRLVPVLEALRAALAEVATDMWAGCEAEADAVVSVTARLGEAASDDHVVALAHRELPVPADPFLRLEHGLVTLRYVRQHDHAEAWLGRGLTAAEMVVMTRLWHGEDPGDDAAAMASLVARGHAGGDPPALTALGFGVREAIEDETNARAQVTFDVLDEAEGEEFVAALRRLPGEL